MYTEQNSRSAIPALKEMEQESGSSVKKVWDSVQLYTVNCAQCLKWRLIPTKEKYEEIREMTCERPFVCEQAREWRPNISCEDEPDVSQDGSLIWAMDRPKIPRTPPGWQRLLRLRAAGGSKFADVYYVAPSKKRFRSMVELSRYLDENPKYLQEGVTASRFCFQPPVPLDDDYVSKRRARADSAQEITGIPFAVNPVSAIVPYENTDPKCGGSGSAATEVKASAEN